MGVPPKAASTGVATALIVATILRIAFESKVSLGELITISIATLAFLFWSDFGPNALNRNNNMV